MGRTLMSTPRFVYAAAGAFGVMLFLSGCGAGTPGEGSTVEVAADYPSFDRAGLVKSATIVVEGTATSSESTVVTPHYEGNDPATNPLAGLSEKEKKKAVQQDGGVAATVVTLHVDAVHKGAVKVGDEIKLIQTGGVVDGVTYRSSADAPLTVGSSYLVFAADSFDGAFTILGGSAGTFRASADGTFTAVRPGVAPFEQLKKADVDSVVNSTS